MRAFDTLLTRTVVLSLFGITLTHVLGLWSYEAAFTSGKAWQFAWRLSTA